MSARSRFPRAVKTLRQKFPRGTIVQVRFVTDAGDVVEFEGLLGERPASPFYTILHAVAGEKDSQP